MDLSEMQTRAAELEQQILLCPLALLRRKPSEARTISTTVGRRTRNGGRSIFLLTNWRISVRRSSGGRNWSRS